MTPPSTTLFPPDGVGRARPAGRNTPDADLAYVLRARTGDPSAFAPLWDKYWRSLYSYFAARVSRREEAEDLASETLLAAFDQLPAFRGAYPQDADAPLADAPGILASQAQRCSFQTFLLAIARYKLAHWIRRKTSRPCCDFTELVTATADEEATSSLEECLGADEAADPLQALMQQDRLDEVCYALADVGMRSAEQFKALFFHYCCQLPHKEVATLLATRNETVNTRLQEGRRTLSRHYQRALQSRAAAVSC
ncbi:MAG TPA: sigma-70 family RNA polymerase sigma factor [Chthonomonadaceae bacterium]|nr:sigma-70 family RNA polymerase sigma factor [Chthonomonadaceae bacterium]